jgi:hypothetical protein
MEYITKYGTRQTLKGGGMRRNTMKDDVENKKRS